jgi:hypothetical protein
MLMMGMNAAKQTPFCIRAAGFVLPHCASAMVRDGPSMQAFYWIDRFGPEHSRLTVGALMSLASAVNSAIEPWPATSIDNDEPSMEQIRKRFRQSHYGSLRTIGCEPVGDHVLLWGSVPCYHLKQMAQVLAGGVVGLAKVKNRIQVCPNVEPR